MSDCTYLLPHLKRWASLLGYYDVSPYSTPDHYLAVLVSICYILGCSPSWGRDIMPKLTLQVRTGDNLLELLAKNETADWIVGKEKIHHITHVQVVNWEGTQMIEGVFDRNASYYLAPPKDDRLVVKFLDGRIVNCKVEFGGRFVVRYIEENLST